jgi:hypothetical protein
MLCDISLFFDKSFEISGKNLAEPCISSIMKIVKIRIKTSKMNMKWCVVLDNVWWYSLQKSSECKFCYVFLMTINKTSSLIINMKVMLYAIELGQTEVGELNHWYPVSDLLGLFSRCRKYVINSLIHGHFHIGLVIIPRPILAQDKYVININIQVYKENMTIESHDTGMVNQMTSIGKCTRRASSILTDNFMHLLSLTTRGLLQLN